MDDNDNSDLGFQQQNSSSSGMHIARLTTTKSVPFGASWDVESKSAAMGSHYTIAATPPYSVSMFSNQGGSSNSHSLQYAMDPNVPDHELSAKLSSFVSGSFSAMVGSFGLPEYDQIGNASCPDYPSTEEVGVSNYSKNVDDHGVMFRRDLHTSDEGGSGSSPETKKRKRANNCESQSEEVGHKRNASQESIEGLKQQDGKKEKTVRSSGPKSGSKPTGKQPKDDSQNEQSSKEDYIHVRARRGQATNSHSLAERVRREKISQRMKYLQDLVPGCDKITGKALMLDEIINYVQSLQRQVEFLSMKLSTVNPGLNIDIDRIMSKDNLGSQIGGSALGFGSGLSSSHPMMHISTQSAVQGGHCSVPQIHTAWDDELQNMFQMGLMPNQAFNTVGLNGKVGTR
ncbi:hypothetical protein ACHQM5_024794 [Ranunculus cassubicifolius]